MATLGFEVTAADTALALGSGDVEVLATPRLLAWCEAATVAELAEHLGRTEHPEKNEHPEKTDVDRTSVGSRVSLEHLAATPVGGQVEVTATLEHRDGRLVRFSLSAVDRSGRLVATGEVTRVVVDRRRFLDRLPPP